MRPLSIALVSLAFAHAAPALADPTHDAVEAYALYQNDVSILSDLDVESARAVNGALARVSRHDPTRVSRGFIAYGALTAAQSPAFAAGVERQINALGHEQYLAQLRNDSTFARRQIPGSTHAIGLILSSARADSARANAAGERYHQLARTSNADWMRSSERAGLQLASARLTPQMRERLRVGALETRPMNDTGAFGGRGFWDSFSGREARAPRAGRGREHSSYTDVTNRMLTVAALVVADASAGERAHVSQLLSEPITNHCLSVQRLELRQCLSVSVDASERTYCLGRHGLAGPGDCFSAMAR